MTTALQLRRIIHRCCERLKPEQHKLAHKLIADANLVGYHSIGFRDKEPLVQDISKLVAINPVDGDTVYLSQQSKLPYQHETFVKIISDELITRDGLWTSMLIFADYLEEQLDISCYGWRWLARNKRKAYDSSTRWPNQKWTRIRNIKNDRPRPPTVEEHQSKWTFDRCELADLDVQKSNVPFYVGTHRIQFNAYQAAATKFVVWAKEVGYSWDA